MSQNGMSSLPNRTQSPINMPRGAHPGAVLLSPKSSSVNVHRIGTNAASPVQQAMSLHDLLDQQSLNMDSHLQIRDDLGRPSALVSPLSNSIMNPTGSTFLDSFSRPASSLATNQVQSQSIPLQSKNPNANIVVNFTNDVNQLCNWISMLTTSQQNTVMDNLLSSLNEEVLHNTKLKLDSMVHSGYLSPNAAPLISPIPNRLHVSNQKHDNPQPLNLDSVLSGDNLYRQWSPLPQHSGLNPVQQPLYDYLNEMQRPRSADPYSTFKKVGSSNNHNPINTINNNSNNSSNSNSNAANNNVHNTTWKAHSSSQTNNGRSSPGTNKTTNFSKPMITTSNNSGNALTTVSSASSITSNSTGNNNGTTSNNNNSMNAKALCDPKLLKNIPAWLKSLRLHKYSDALGCSPWYELIYLDDETLETMGVSALGARRKLLKAFSIVKEYKENDLIDPTAYS